MVGKLAVLPALKCRVSAASLPVLLRRLYEISLLDDCEDHGDAADSLCTDILDSLGYPDAESHGFSIVSPADEQKSEEVPS